MYSQRLTTGSAVSERLPGVQMESKLGFHSNSWLDQRPGSVSSGHKRARVACATMRITMKTRDPRTVLRKFSRLFLSSILPAVLVSGLCLPCLSAFSAAPVPLCCKHRGDCGKPARNDPATQPCRMQASQPGYFGPTASAMVQVQPAAELSAEPVRVNYSGTLLVGRFIPPETSPPDLFLIHSSLLI
jgi:hypothetical protein